MPPAVSTLALGVGLTSAGLGLVVLLMLLTMTPRARPTLIWGGRPWNLRTLALVLGVASGLCLMGPRVERVAGPPRDRAADDASHGLQDDDAASHHTTPSAPGAPAARAPGIPHPTDSPVPFSARGEPSVALTPPARREPEEAERRASPPEAVNLTGEWTILHTIMETSYPPFHQLRLGFRVTIHHDGEAFYGVGEKQRENGRVLPVAARRPLRIQGTIADGAVITATFQEEGGSRRITGHFRLHRQDRDRLTGTFASTAARARGLSHWIRTSSGVAQAGRHDQASRDGRPVPPPEPLSAADLQRRGTTQGPRGARQRDDQAARRRDEPRAPARPWAPGDQRATPQRRPSLQRGMTPAEVRALLGEPASVEAIAGFVFWHYGTAEHEQDVVFEQGTERVHGWLGWARGPTDGPAE